MKIAIVGSIACSDKLIAIAEQLERAGHAVDLPYCTLMIRRGEITLDSFKAEKAKHGDGRFRTEASEDLLKRYWRIIGESDVVVVANTNKEGRKNYIGGNALIEMSFAYVLSKPLFLLNPIPEDVPYRDEVVAMQPIVLHGDLSQIRMRTLASAQA